MQPKPPLAFPGQRIGLLGGSFNPPHAAHKLITDTACRRLGLDAVWWVLTPGNPLKFHGDLASLDKRLRLCRGLVHNPNIKMTAFESDLPSAYTAATLAFLKKRYPAVKFVWLMGADNLASFHIWQDWQDITRQMPFAVVDRPGWRLPALAHRTAHLLSRHYIPEYKAQALATMKAPAWTFLTGRLSQLSSTEIRAKAHKISTLRALRNI